MQSQITWGRKDCWNNGLDIVMVKKRPPPLNEINIFQTKMEFHEIFQPKQKGN